VAEARAARRPRTTALAAADTEHSAVEAAVAAFDERGPAWFELARAAVVRLARREQTGDADTAAELDALDADLASARERFHAELAAPTPFATIAFNAVLDGTSAEVLAIAVACDADRRLRRLIAQAQGQREPALTLDAVARLLDEQATLALAPDAPLRRAALVELVSDLAWSDQRVAVHSAVVWALLGDLGRDPDLPADLRLVDALPGGSADLVVVIGPDVVRRRIAGMAHAAGGQFLITGRFDDEAAWPAIVREATLTGAGVLVEVDDDLPVHCRRWIERAMHLSWIVSSRTDLPLDRLPSRPWLSVEAGDELPSDAEWAAWLGGVPRTHPLTMTQLDIVSRAIDAYGGDLDAAVRRLASGRLEHLARRIRPRREWSDLILSPSSTELLRSIVDRYRHADVVYDDWGFLPAPSRGLVALFSGPSGTGKTLATEVLAGDLGLDVFKVNLSTVVSKYIGETEKNLEEMFDAASAGNLLLFFDEADSLIGKRSEVRESRDRYANIEVSYLLQRLESYDGLVVMATNFEKNIDDAFLRRIHVRVAFAVPGADERLLLWEHNLPAKAPRGDLDLRWLATQFDLTGGQIRNAAVHAAFLSAAAGEAAIAMEHLVNGVIGELRKVGRIVKPAELGRFAHVLSA
jgi:ATPase family associated with various cellular activities (AAA)